jgi:metal-dependent hydrolase (beta-lactamase superfamily II)
VSHRVHELAVTVLADNYVAAGEGVLAEHGLSLLVSADGRSLLFDVGQSGVFIGNAARLGLDLSPARQVVLSHAHYDHTGAAGAYRPSRHLHQEVRQTAGPQASRDRPPQRAARPRS